MQENVIVEYNGQNCYIFASDHCFLKSNNYFTKSFYSEEFLTFIRAENYRSVVMTSARCRPYCKKNKNNIGCFNGQEKSPRNIKEGNKFLFIYNKHFCLFWKSDGISFNQAVENELQPNSKVFDKIIFDKHAESFIKFEYKP